MQFFDPTETAAIYERPDNGYREAVPRKAWLWMFLFGIIYLAVRGLWREFATWAVIFTLLIVIAWPIAVLAGMGFWTYYAVNAKRVLQRHYLRRGWRELDPWEQEGLPVSSP